MTNREIIEYLMYFPAKNEAVMYKDGKFFSVESIKLSSDNVIILEGGETIGKMKDSELDTIIIPC